jgi:acyl-CoA dehydrogenase
MAKAYASEAAVNCANLAIQVYGGAGFNEETGMPKLARDARIYTICKSDSTTLTIDEGTSQIQRLIVSRHLSALYPA